MKTIFTVLLFTAGLTSTSICQDTSIPQIKRNAERGDAAAQCMLGARYISGDGVKQDYAAGLSWLRKSADQGYAPAQSGLGIDYAAKKDDAQAAVWLRRAADQDDGDGQLALGELELRRGDRIEALKWFLFSSHHLSGSDLARAEQASNEIIKTLTPTERAKLAELKKAKEKAASEDAPLVVVGIDQGDTLSVRSGPGAKYPLVGSLPSGTRKIKAIDSTTVGDAYWIKIQVGNLKGWVNGKYVGPASLNP